MKNLKLSLLLGLFLIAPMQAQKWPTVISPQQGRGTYQVRNQGEFYLYESSSYRIQSPHKISPQFIKNFILSAESVALALRSLPLPLSSPPSRRKPLIQIALDESTYHSAGGAPGTGGFYDGLSNTVIVRWDQLNQKSPQSKLLHRPTFDLLVHELAHLGMRDKIWKIESWLTEGVAEYLASAHLSEGRFDFRKIELQIREHIRRQSGQTTAKIPATKIAKLLKLSSQDWLKRNATLAPREALEAYTSALLLTHYTFHGGSERLNKLRKYLAKLEEVRLQNDQRPLLFSSQEAALIEKQIKTYWQSRGLDLLFK